MATFQYGGLVEQVAVTATAAGTTTLVNTSKQIQVFTGSTTQTVVLPSATTMAVGQKYEICNQSTGALTIQFNGGAAFTDAYGTNYSTVAAHTSLSIILQTNGTSAGTWAVVSSAADGSLTNPMTAVGDLIIGGASGAPTRLAGNTTTTKEFLTQTGTGSASAAEVWSTIASSDLPTNGVSNSILAQMAASTIKGNASGSTANAADLTVAQANALLNQYVTGNVTLFTASGTFTTPANSSTSTVYLYEMLAGGGGGGGANGTYAVGGGGGAGCYAWGTFTGVAASTGITITIGSGGTAGTSSGGAGGAGGNTVIGSPVSVTIAGGAGAPGSTSATSTGNGGGAGGSVVSGSPTFAMQGQPGGGGFSNSAANFYIGGNGASSIYGGGGPGGMALVSAAPIAATGYGAGGGGGITTSTAGGAGRGGLVRIWQLTP